jgi:hypothetical protein
MSHSHAIDSVSLAWAAGTCKLYHACPVTQPGAHDEHCVNQKLTRSRYRDGGSHDTCMCLLPMQVIHYPCNTAIRCDWCKCMGSCGFRAVCDTAVHLDCRPASLTFSGQNNLNAPLQICNCQISAWIAASRWDMHVTSSAGVSASSSPLTVG